MFKDLVFEFHGVKQSAVINHGGLLVQYRWFPSTDPIVLALPGRLVKGDIPDTSGWEPGWYIAITQVGSSDGYPQHVLQGPFGNEEDCSIIVFNLVTHPDIARPYLYTSVDLGFGIPVMEKDGTVRYPEKVSI